MKLENKVCVITGSSSGIEEAIAMKFAESGFSADKRRFGWIVTQKRSDRINTALFSSHVLRNLFLLAD